jgi:hypothetical protein
MATEQTTGVFRVGLRLIAIDGTCDVVAETFAHALSCGRMRSGTHQRPFPQVCCLSLAEVGTPIIEMVVAPCRVAEHQLFPRLPSCAVQPGMLVVRDRGGISAAGFRALVHQQQARALA